MHFVCIRSITGESLASCHYALLISMQKIKIEAKDVFPFVFVCKDL